MLALLVLALTTTSALAAGPDRSPHRYFPAQGLVAYLEYEGLDAHAKAWEATAAHQILAKTPAGAMMTDLFRQLADGPIKQATWRQFDASDPIALIDSIAHRGLACGLYVQGEDIGGAILVLRGVGRTALPRRFPAIQGLLKLGGFTTGPERVRGRMMLPLCGEDGWREPPNPLQIDQPPGTQVDLPTPPLAWAWMEGDDLILVASENPTLRPGATSSTGDVPDPLLAVLEAIEGKAPNVTTHPGYQSALAEGSDLNGFEPNGLCFLELVPEFGGPIALVDAGVMAVDVVIGSIFQFMPSNAPKVAKAPKAQPKKDEQLDLASVKIEAPSTPTTIDLTGIESLVDHADVAIVPPVPPTTDTPDARTALNEDLDDFERELIRDLGLEGVKRIVGRWGFQGKALLSDIRFEDSRPRKGVPALFEQPAIPTNRLPVVPPEATDFVIASFGPDAFYQKMLETYTALEPDVAEELPMMEASLREMLGFRLREDLLRHVGPTWAMINLPGKDSKKHSVLAAAIDDPDAVEKVMSPFVKQFDETLRSYAEQERAEAPKGRAVGAFGMRPLPAPDRGYRIDLPSFEFSGESLDWSDLNPDASRTLRFYLLLGKSTVAVAHNLDAARAVLKAGSRDATTWKPAGELANALAGLPADLTFLSVTDPALCGLPDAIAGLPETARYLLTGVNVSKDLRDRTGWSALNFLGLTRPGQPWPRLDRSHIPTPDELRRSIFASVLATAVDDRGYRIVHRQPLPFAGLSSELAFHCKWWIPWEGFHWPDSGRFAVSFTSPRMNSSN